MSDFINKLYRNHSLVYKVLLFITTTFLIVYMFPKTGKFKYNFEKAKPWQSENLYALFNFPIKNSFILGFIFGRFSSKREDACCINLFLTVL